MTDNQLISVVMPTYRVQAQFLPDALRSVLAQTYSTLEVIVVHDGSDQVQEMIGKFAGDSKLKAIREKGRGYIAALNQGIKEATGAFIAFCDSDDTQNINHVRVLADELKAHPEIGLAFDNLEYFCDTNQSEQELGNRNTGSGKNLLIEENRAVRLAGKQVSLQEIFADNLISGPAFMVPKRIFSEVGVFDENSFLVNDLHLFYRIGARFPIRFVNYLGVRKRVHENNLTVIHPHYEYGVRSLENIRRCYPQVYRRIGRRLFHRKLARKYYRLGLYHQRSGAPDMAQEMFKNALLLRKFSARYYWKYLTLKLAN